MTRPCRDCGAPLTGYGKSTHCQIGPCFAARQRRWRAAFVAGQQASRPAAVRGLDVSRMTARQRFLMGAGPYARWEVSSE